MCVCACMCVVGNRELKTCPCLRVYVHVCAFVCCVHVKPEGGSDSCASFFFPPFCNDSSSYILQWANPGPLRPPGP